MSMVMINELSRFGGFDDLNILLITIDLSI